MLGRKSLSVGLAVILSIIPIRKVKSGPIQDRGEYYLDRDSSRLVEQEERDFNGRLYVVSSGDINGLSGIAERLYEDASRWTEIYLENKALLGDNPNIIQPGMRLRLIGHPINLLPNPYPISNHFNSPL